MSAPDPELAVLKYVMQVFGRPEEPISETLEGNAKEFSKYRLRTRYGKANQYVCFDCGNQATKWTYTYDDAGEWVTPNGIRFSLNPERYVPRCGVCYYQFTNTQNVGTIFALEKCEHVKHVPFLLNKHYEFKFCNKCGTYRRVPRKGYYAKHAFPSLSIGPQIYPKL